MTSNKSRVLLASVLCLLTLSACDSGGRMKAAAPAKDAVATPAKDGVAATVNGMPISESHVKLLAQMRGDLDTLESRKNIIDNLAVQLLASQEAIKKGLDKQPDVSDRVELNQRSLWATAFVQDYLKNNPVSEDVLKAEYNRVKSQSRGIEYKARHIMVEKEAEAKYIIVTLKKNPKAFAALAREKSKDTITKESGGDLGWVTPRGRDPELETAMARLTKGKFTEEPVRSQFGYHVILLEDSRPKQPPPMEQLKAQLRYQLEQEKVQKLLDEMKAKAKIDIAAASAPGGPPEKEVKRAEPGKK